MGGIQSKFAASKRPGNHLRRVFFARSSLPAALILATWTNSSWAPDEVPHALPGLARHSGQANVRGLTGRYSGTSAFFIIGGILPQDGNGIGINQTGYIPFIRIMIDTYLGITLETARDKAGLLPNIQRQAVPDVTEPFLPAKDELAFSSRANGRRVRAIVSYAWMV
jgi:hypothetical protein